MHVVSGDSATQGYERGRQAALAREPQPQPRKDLLDADPGFQSYWLAVPDGFHAGQAERRAREQAAPA